MGSTMLLNVYELARAVDAGRRDDVQVERREHVLRMKNTVIGAAMLGRISARKLLVMWIRYMNW